MRVFLGPSRGRSMFHIPLRGQCQGQLCVLDPPKGSSLFQGPSRGSSMSQDHPGISSTIHVPPRAAPVPPGGDSAPAPGLPQDESRSRLQPRASMSLLMWEIILSHSSSEGTDCSSELPAAVPLEAEAGPSERR